MKTEPVVVVFVHIEKFDQLVRGEETAGKDKPSLPGDFRVLVPLSWIKRGDARGYVIIQRP